MTTTPAPTHITLDEFTEILSRYPATMSALSKTNTAPKLIKPDESSELSSEELDVWRLDTLPVAVKARDKPCIAKEELQKLLGCKMARGKRRQALPKLIATNDPSTVTTVTTTAFDHLLAAPSPPTTSLILATLKELTDPLKGVGPATASYILAVVAPDTVPVFSDEAYRWITYSTSREGWGKKIKYDAKEYRTYVDGVKALVEKLGEGVTAGDVEKVGFVLGKEGAEFRGTPSVQPQSGLDALDAALGLETEQSVTVSSTPTTLVIPVARSKVARKRKADKNPIEDAEEPSESKPAQKKKTSEPKRGGVKMGRVFIRTP